MGSKRMIYSFRICTKGVWRKVRLLAPSYEEAITVAYECYVPEILKKEITKIQRRKYGDD